MIGINGITELDSKIIYKVKKKKRNKIMINAIIFDFLI
jgi:hypothetical protein